jgi:hypothetical protein
MQNFVTDVFSHLPDRQQRVAEMNMAREHARTRTVKRINDFLTELGLDAVPLSKVQPVIPQTTVGPLDSDNSNNTEEGETNNTDSNTSTPSGDGTDITNTPQNNEVEN